MMLRCKTYNQAVAKNAVPLERAVEQQTVRVQFNKTDFNNVILK